MKTLERRIAETLRHEAERLPSEETAHSLAPMRQDRRRLLRRGLAAPAAVVLVFLLAAPLIWLTAGRGPESPPSSISATDQSGVSTVTTSPGTDSVDSPVETTTGSTTPTFVVTDLETPGPDPAEVGDAAGRGVGEVLESTGKNYDPLPEAMADATTIEDRVVVVGSNETQSAGIWYSDGGVWTPADIDFPPGVNIGDNPGDFRLADGLLHLETLPSGQLLAWQPIQRLISSSDAETSRPEPVTAGTILITSTDGASWTASIVDHNFTQVASWRDGVVATSWTKTEDGQATSAALWSQNLTSWTEVADLGEGEAYHLVTDDNGLTVSLVSWETTVDEDGSITYGPDRTTRQVSLTTASGADEPEDLSQDGEQQAPSAAAIEASTTDGYYEIAIVTLADDASRVESELEALGLDVSIDFVPVSPSLVGQLVATTDRSDGSQVDWEYVEPDDFGEPPVLRIPTSFDGTLRLHIGRPAEDGEAFTSAAKSALHPGEPLHCTDIEGMTVAEAAPVIAAAGVTVEYYDANGDGIPLGDQVPQDWYIVSTTPTAGGAVQAELMATWPPDGRTPEYLALLNEGCE